MRSSLPKDQVVRVVTGAVHRVDAHLALSDIRSGTDILGDQLRTSRLSVLLTCVSAATATALAMVGILGVLSILVAQRLREIGLRKALGAGSASVWRYVLAKAMRPVGVGMVLGLVAACVGTRFLESQIFGVSPLDPPAFVLPVLVLALAAMAACLVPGLRANRADPVELLKSE